MSLQEQNGSDDAAERAIRQFHHYKRLATELGQDLSQAHGEINALLDRVQFSERREAALEGELERARRENAVLVSRLDTIYREIQTVYGEVHSIRVGAPNPALPEPRPGDAARARGDPLVELAHEIGRATELTRSLTDKLEGGQPGEQR